MPFREPEKHEETSHSEEIQKIYQSFDAEVSRKPYKDQISFKEISEQTRLLAGQIPDSGVTLLTSQFITEGPEQNDPKYKKRAAGLALATLSETHPDAVKKVLLEFRSQPPDYYTPERMSRFMLINSLLPSNTQDELKELYKSDPNPAIDAFSRAYIEYRPEKNQESVTAQKVLMGISPGAYRIESMVKIYEHVTSSNTEQIELMLRESKNEALVAAAQTALAVIHIRNGDQLSLKTIAALQVDSQKHQSDLHYSPLAVTLATAIISGEPKTKQQAIDILTHESVSGSSPGQRILRVLGRDRPLALSEDEKADVLIGIIPAADSQIALLSEQVIGHFLETNKTSPDKILEIANTAMVTYALRHEPVPAYILKYISEATTLDQASHNVWRNFVSTAILYNLQLPAAFAAQMPPDFISSANFSLPFNEYLTSQETKLTPNQTLLLRGMSALPAELRSGFRDYLDLTSSFGGRTSYRSASILTDEYVDYLRKVLPHAGAEIPTLDAELGKLLFERTTLLSVLSDLNSNHIVPAEDGTVSVENVRTTLSFDKLFKPETWDQLKDYLFETPTATHQKVQADNGGERGLVCFDDLGLSKYFPRVIEMLTPEDINRLSKADQTIVKLALALPYNRRERFFQFRHSANGIDAADPRVISEFVRRSALVEKLATHHLPEVRVLTKSMGYTLVLGSEDPEKVINQIITIYANQDIPDFIKIMRVYEAVFPPERFMQLRFASETLHEYKQRITAAGGPEKAALVVTEAYTYIATSLLRVHLNSSNRTLVHALRAFSETQTGTVNSSRLENFAASLLPTNQVMARTKSFTETYATLQRLLGKEYRIENLTQIMDARRRLASERNRLSVITKEDGQYLELHEGDLVKTFWDRFLVSLADNGFVSPELLKEFATIDETPGGSDFSGIRHLDRPTFEEQVNLGALYGNLGVIVRTTPANEQTAPLIKNRFGPQNAKPFYQEAYELTTVYEGLRHMEVTVGIGWNDVDAFYIPEQTLKQEPEILDRLKMLVARNGVYIPIVNKFGKVIYSYEEWEEMTKVEFIPVAPGSVSFDAITPENTLTHLREAIPAAAHILSSDKEPYTTNTAHTGVVLENFARLKDYQSSLLTSTEFALLLTLHDIGKPQSIIFEGSAASQHEYTEGIAMRILDNTNLPTSKTNIILSIISADDIGEFFQEHHSAIETASIIIDRARALGVSASEYFKLLRYYFLCDAGAYSSDVSNWSLLDGLITTSSGHIDFTDLGASKIAEVEKVLQGINAVPA